MAQDLYGKMARPGQYSFATAENEPPPSTLAAQLVTDIHKTSRSLAPDDNEELKRLTATIDQIKNNPDLLQTESDRVEHNHTLIYVCGGVVLQNLKWDDPFGKTDRLRETALKAIRFLNVTINETPRVLNCTTDGQTLMYRGQEPLWLWVLPKVLKMLGHCHCQALEPIIESFFERVFWLTTQQSALWDLGVSLMRFLQVNLAATIKGLKSRIPSAINSQVDIEVPPEPFFQDYPTVIPKKCSYTLDSFEHAVRHAAGLVTIMKNIVLADYGPQPRLTTIFGSYAVWLSDCIQPLVSLQCSWPSHMDLRIASTIRAVADLASKPSSLEGQDMVTSQKANTALVLALIELSEQPHQLFNDDSSGPVLRGVLPAALVHLASAALNHRPLSVLIASRLSKQLRTAALESPGTPGTDFMRSIDLLFAITEYSGDIPPESLGLEIVPDAFVDGRLRRRVSSLDISWLQKPGSEGGDEPTYKRRKTTESPSAVGWIMKQLNCLLIKDPSLHRPRITDLQDSFSLMFAELDEDRQCRVLDLLSRIACAADGTIRFRRKAPGAPIETQCSFCSGSEDVPSCLEPTDRDAACRIFVNILKPSGSQESRRARVIAMMALKRLAKHNPDSSFLDFETTVQGQWCLDSLKSSTRELRIAAGRTFGIYFADKPVPSPDIKHKRKNALEYLKSLSDRNSAHLYESCILAWGQVGRVVAEDELGLVLLTLVEFLGHNDAIVSAWAFTEILNVANARKLTTESLFLPFWPSLAFTVVKDLVSKPQTASRVAELLQLPNGVPGLLILLQKHALPWLVLRKKRDVIQKIADARKDEFIFDCIVADDNLASILALLLSQDVPDVVSFSISLLCHVSKRFETTKFVEVLKTAPLPLALELFKLAADGDDARKQRVRGALATMATLTMEIKDKKIKKSQLIGSFLQPHALGLAARFGELITDSQPGVQISLRERRQCLLAMEEMIRVARSYMCIARPQICACLTTALESDELRSLALSCWEAMVHNMDDVDVEALIEMTILIIKLFWDGFDEQSKARAKGMVQFFLESHPQSLEKYGHRLPGLDHIDELEHLNKEILALRPKLDARGAFAAFVERLQHENPNIVQQALLELVQFLKTDQSYLQTSAISEQPDTVVPSLARALLDCASKYNDWYPEIAQLCAECIGLIGCLDSNRIETTREEQQFVLIHNFENAAEITSFVVYLLDNIIVKAYLSTTDLKFQGYLSYAMQELLDRTDLKLAVEQEGKGEMEPVYRKWLSMKVSTREALLPFLSSRFWLQPIEHLPAEYPIFRGPAKQTYPQWIRAFALDLLNNAQNVYSEILFAPLCRLVRVQDVSVTEALLPYVVLHLMIGQEHITKFRDKITAELVKILEYQPAENASYAEREGMKLHYEAVFRILDYCMRWLQVRRSLPQQTPREELWVKGIEGVVAALSPELMARRAVYCNQYARALFFLEPHIKSMKDDKGPEAGRLLQTIQDIYTQIDDPDGLEGISAQLQTVSLDQQALNHRKAGRWTAAQTWYEIRLAESPDDTDTQLDLLTCLKESGQHDVLLNYVEGMKDTSGSINRIIPFAAEASWATNRWETLGKYLRTYTAGDVSEVFNLGVGKALLCLGEGDIGRFQEHVQTLRSRVAGSMTYATTSSLRACHDLMLKCHVLADLEMIVEESFVEDGDRQPFITALNRRLEVLGAYVSDKQYLLGVRRAAMELMRPQFGNEDISSLWLSTARLARKSGAMHQSFNAVLHAQQLGDGSAIIENARLLYKDGHHRKAIQVLQMAIDTNSFINESSVSAVPTSSRSSETQRNLLTARAHLLLAKWLDSTGQTHVSALRSKYQQATSTHKQWEKGHYYLGRHYKKVLESEKALKTSDQTDEYLSGETAKLVIENYLRSLNFGTKYLYQTLPRILTLWLELGAQVAEKPVEAKITPSRELYQRRKDILKELHNHFLKYLPRMPAFVFYTALAQIVARIAHPNPDVFKILLEMIIKVVGAHPRQALWSLFSFMTTKTNTNRGKRGLQVLQAVRQTGKKANGTGSDLYDLLKKGEKLAEQLLLACNNGDFQSNRTTVASIVRDLHFNHKCTPCPLVVPIETCLSATLPTLTDNIKKHKAFSRDVITIEAFLDQVLVLGSLAKPRKLTARGSDGKTYGLLIKPKDDLRTDQRLMEFNSLINRSLKRDAESSKRQLYIKTYAVTPLNEECGIIEWVDGLKTLRDILLGLYKSKGITPNYGHIAQLMKEAAASEENLGLFTETVLGLFPPVLQEWFVSQFPNPSTWFAARLRYARSCAVMSMVGTILGLGDRHGENVLLEEGNGGIFHVDFNCLFDKGLTFAQPERVPFRLTHNMVTAMGIYGYEGPFRHCSELTLKVLRQQEETLMTILEAFIYDPTLDLQKTKRRHEVVKLNPTSVVDSIRRKVRGLLPDESIPLGVEGQVEELIKQAVDPRKLAAMYIGWCPFL